MFLKRLREETIHIEQNTYIILYDGWERTDEINYAEVRCVEKDGNFFLFTDSIFKHKVIRSDTNCNRIPYHHLKELTSYVKDVIMMEQI
jgi:hypothetical protein